MELAMDKNDNIQIATSIHEHCSLAGTKLAVKKPPGYQLEGFKFQTQCTQVTQVSFPVIFPICTVSLESVGHSQWECQDKTNAHLNWNTSVCTKIKVLCFDYLPIQPDVEHEGQNSSKHHSTLLSVKSKSSEKWLPYLLPMWKVNSNKNLALSSPETTGLDPELSTMLQSWRQHRLSLSCLAGKLCMQVVVLLYRNRF